MGKPSVYTDALTRAAIAVGGEARLAAALRVRVKLVRQWLAGTAYPPTKISVDGNPTSDAVIIEAMQVLDKIVVVTGGANGIG